MTYNYLPKIIMMQIIPTFPTYNDTLICHYWSLFAIIEYYIMQMGHYSIKNNGRIMAYNVDAKRPHVLRVLYI